MTEREGRMVWNGHETWYRVVGDLESNASAAGRRLPRRPGRGARLLRGDRRPRPLRPRVCPVRPDRVRQEPAPSGRSCGLLDAAALQGRAGRADASPRDRRPLCDRRPVVGRDARDGVRARSSGRPAGHRRRRLAGEHDAVGLGGEPPQRGPAARRAGDPDAARGGRDDRRPRVRDRRQGLLRSPPLPRAVARRASSAASTRSPPTRPCTTR